MQPVITAATRKMNPEEIANTILDYCESGHYGNQVQPSDFTFKYFKGEESGQPAFMFDIISTTNTFQMDNIIGTIYIKSNGRILWSARKVKTEAANLSTLSRGLDAFEECITIFEDINRYLGL